MNLYLLETRKLGDFYIIAENPYEAQKTLLDALNSADYGFYDHRKVEVIRHMAELIKPGVNGTLNFSSGNKLLINNQ